MHQHRCDCSLQSTRSAAMAFGYLWCDIHKKCFDFSQFVQFCYLSPLQCTSLNAQFSNHATQKNPPQNILKYREKKPHNADTGLAVLKDINFLLVHSKMVHILVLTHSACIISTVSANPSGIRRGDHRQEAVSHW